MRWSGHDKHKVYRGENTGVGAQTVLIGELKVEYQDKATVTHRALPLQPSLQLYNHSPSGFQWGYAGSGCSQLALAILFDCTGDRKLALDRHQDFKNQFILGARKKLFITEAEIWRWLSQV